MWLAQQQEELTQEQQRCDEVALHARRILRLVEDAFDRLSADIETGAGGRISLPPDSGEVDGLSDEYLRLATKKDRLQGAIAFSHQRIREEARAHAKLLYTQVLAKGSSFSRRDSTRCAYYVW